MSKRANKIQAAKRQLMALTRGQEMRGEFNLFLSHNIESFDVNYIEILRATVEAYDKTNEE